MVVKKQIAKSNVKLNKKPQNKQKVMFKKPVVVEESESEDNVSFDDMDEEELKKMLGNSSNSDLESDNFSEEEIKSTEAKVNKKRKLDSDDEVEDNTNKKSKTLDVPEEEDEVNSEDIDDSDEDDDEDEDMEDDSFINDNDEEVEISSKIDSTKTEKNITKDKIKVQNVKNDIPKPENVKKDNVSVENTKEKTEKTYNVEDFQKIYEDTPKLESESLRKEVCDRLLERKNNTFILLNLPYKFNFSMAKELIPDMVSIIIPYDVRRHQIKGNAYVDVQKPEQVQKYCSTLNGFKIKNNKLSCFPFTKVDDNVDNYNCTRLVISNLPVKTTVEALKRVMTKASEVRMMPLKKSDKKMTLVAFADYPCVEDAIFDYDNKHGLEFEGFPINVKFQSRSNTNVTKSKVAFNKKALHILGINKSITQDDLKKLFPQAINIHWKVGDQVATIDYSNIEDCQVDFKNSLKNKPSPKMKIFYKFDKSQNPDKKKAASVNLEIEEKKGNVENKSNDDKRNNKKNFQKNSKFEGKNSNGVKKPNFKNSKQRTVKKIETGKELAATINIQEKQTIDKTKKETQKVLNEKVMKKNLNKDFKSDENKKNNDNTIKGDLIIKKREKRKMKKLLKKKLKKAKNE